MTKLNDTQAVILSAAAQRDDGAVLPLPDSLKIKGGAVDKVLGSLKARGLVEHQGVSRGATTRRRSGSPAPASRRSASRPRMTCQRPRHRATRARRRPIPVSRRLWRQTRRPEPTARPRRRRKARRPRGKTKTTKATPAEKPTPRAGTKQALMIKLLQRPEGATVEQIAAATGWQHHTIRGAISGALKKKLGFTIEATREVGPSGPGAKDSSTVYRIAGSSPITE
jgi:hypothetical protein